MRIFVFSVCVLLALGSLPSGTSIPAQAAYHQYRNQFLAGHPGLSVDAIGTAHTEDAVFELTLGEAADLYAERMVSFIEDHKGTKPPARARGHGPGDRGGPNAAAAEPVVAWAGQFVIVEFMFHSGSNQSVACSHLHDQAHYTVAVPIPGDPDNWYVGAAFSDVAAYGNGQIYDVNTQETFQYHYPVYYAGASDFLCYEFRVGNTLILTNNPTVVGVVIGAED